MPLEEMLNKLDGSHQAHLKEQEIINQFIRALEKKAKDLVSEHYPREVNMLSAEGYRALDDMIYNCASNLAVDVANVFYRHIEND